MIKIRTPYRFLIAAGGTGGHLFPAIAVAQEILNLKPESEILFIGTKHKLEAGIIPDLGYKFKTLWISGLRRGKILSNLLFPLKVLVSAVKSLAINISFKPRVAIGGGAYVSGPALWGSSILGAKIILLEQNIFPGVTNRLLEKKASKVYLSFDESKKYFRISNKLEVVGNPVRSTIKLLEKNTAKSKYGFDENKPVLFVSGGSLGAKTINRGIHKNLNELVDAGIQIIWQTGRNYFDQYKNNGSSFVKVVEFVENMEDAYSAADLIIARAGATTIAEISKLGLPVIFVPSPNVAANHQFKNAEMFKKANAAGLIEDKNFEFELINRVNELIFDKNKLAEYSEKIKSFFIKDAAKKIAADAIKMCEIL